MNKPKLPFEGATIEFHNKNSVWKGAELWLSEEQKTGYIEGNELRKKIPKTAYNACVLDYLLEHPEEIPESWKTVGWIYFWGTIYRISNGHLYVRYLDWIGEQWVSRYNWLGIGWHGNRPSAVRASKNLEPKKLGTKLSSEDFDLRISALEKDMQSIKKFLII